MAEKEGRVHFLYPWSLPLLQLIFFHLHPQLALSGPECCKQRAQAAEEEKREEE